MGEGPAKQAAARDKTPASGIVQRRGVALRFGGELPPELQRVIVRIAAVRTIEFGRVT